MKNLLLFTILLFSISTFAQKKSCKKKVNKYELSTKHKCRFKQKSNSNFKKNTIVASKPRQTKYSINNYYKNTTNKNFSNVLVSK